MEPWHVIQTEKAVPIQCLGGFLAPMTDRLDRLALQLQSLIRGCLIRRTSLTIGACVSRRGYRTQGLSTGVAEIRDGWRMYSTQGIDIPRQKQNYYNTTG